MQCAIRAKRRLLRPAMQTRGAVRPAQCRQCLRSMRAFCHQSIWHLVLPQCIRQKHKTPENLSIYRGFAFSEYGGEGEIRTLILAFRFVLISAITGFASTLPFRFIPVRLSVFDTFSTYSLNLPDLWPFDFQSPPSSLKYKFTR